MKLFTIFIILLMSFNAYSWDGKREGFLLGFGVGAGVLDYEDVNSEHLFSDNYSEKVSTLNFMPKIGYAFTNKFALIYMRHPFLFDMDNKDDDDENITTCLEGIGFNYYFSETAPSLYIGAAFGDAYFFKGTDYYEDDALKGKGTGKFFSIGYEFSSHYSIEFTSLSGELDDDKGRFYGNAVMFNILGY